MPPRDPWGHKLRRCIHCGQIGPRVVVLGGYAHRRCIPKPIQAIIEPEGDDGPRVRLPAYSAVDDRITGAAEGIGVVRKSPTHDPAFSRVISHSEAPPAQRRHFAPIIIARGQSTGLRMLSISCRRMSCWRKLLNRHILRDYPPPTRSVQCEALAIIRRRQPPRPRTSRTPAPACSSPLPAPRL